MMNVISPHLDDAVLSLGKFMQTEQCIVHTMCARIPPPDVITEYDMSTGFASSAKAMAARIAEDDDAGTNVLEFVRRRYGWHDLQYEPYVNDIGHGYLLDAMASIMSPKVHTLAPLGLSHPDHRLISHYARRAVPKGELLFYEELPYRVLWPEQVGEALRELREQGWHLEPWPMPVTPHAGDDRKRHAIECYRSQYPHGPEQWLPLVPERIWRGVR